jgi:hypothetical protein
MGEGPEIRTELGLDATVRSAKRSAVGGYERCAPRYISGPPLHEYDDQQAPWQGVVFSLNQLF